ncbi:MAG: nucleotidyltransferase domain-containing protein [Flavobacteriales bacterium]
MKYGLSEKQLREITDILSTYDEVTEATLFGSRAMDTYKEASDVDYVSLVVICANDLNP